MKISMLILSLLMMFQVEALAGPRGRMKRTFKGVKSGEVTRGEFKRIARGERRIRRARKEARSDGKVTARERVRIGRMKARQNGRIYRAKHNNRAQGE